MTVMEQAYEETTSEWLELFLEDRRLGRLAKSIFWRLALHSLPEGVNPEHPEVKAALEEIRQANEDRPHA